MGLCPSARLRLANGFVAKLRAALTCMRERGATGATCAATRRVRYAAGVTPATIAVPRSFSSGRGIPRLVNFSG